MKDHSAQVGAVSNLLRTLAKLRAFDCSVRAFVPWKKSQSEHRHPDHASLYMSDFELDDREVVLSVAVDFDRPSQRSKYRFVRDMGIDKVNGRLRRTC
jgi:hypothetical protein